METNILLESGTNELEILEFTLEITITESMLQRFRDFTISANYTSSKFTSKCGKEYSCLVNNDYGN